MILCVKNVERWYKPTYNHVIVAKNGEYSKANLMMIMEGSPQ
jgi:hypothetical protein